SNGVGRYELNSYLGWPDGRPLSYFDRLRQDSWFAAHHVELWTTYQPANRFGLFQYIEFGWLVVLSALLVAAAVLLIRRRSA
ncbi:MAG TPA: hypothetical protein VFI65_06695, partial [Streptosporangiaceae bacterium]|nr:hypothetical protein [Streptosporangiaceae bacterium]